MPIYAYLCNVCGPFERIRPMEASELPEACPVCEASAPRMVTAVQLNLMPGNKRIVHSRNEKSAHEPRVTPARCDHHHGEHDHGCNDKKHKHQHNHAIQGQTSARPWQVGH